jgi:hypothetical protein
MRIYLYYLFDGRGDEERRCDTLFDAKKYAMGGCDLYKRAIRGGSGEEKGLIGFDLHLWLSSLA